MPTSTPIVYRKYSTKKKTKPPQKTTTTVSSDSSSGGGGGGSGGGPQVLLDRVPIPPSGGSASWDSRDYAKHRSQEVSQLGKMTRCYGKRGEKNPGDRCGLSRVIRERGGKGKRHDGFGIPNQKTGMVGVYKMSETCYSARIQDGRGYRVTIIEGFDTKEQADQVDASS